MQTTVLTRSVTSTAAPAPERAGQTPPPPAPPREGDGGGERRVLPLGVSVALILLIATLFTYLGMLTQIWANISGAQLPGA
ncbi:MAG TPA: hypothetical protein VJ794_10795 [Gemmatimonadales bacterium]|nr:hypothetical protein [Gemmatimonadales bacterium]